MSEDLTLVDLIKDNEIYNELVDHFEKRRKVASEYMDSDSFISEELVRIKNVYLESPKVEITGDFKVKETFNGARFTKMAYERLTNGLNQRLDVIVQDALKNMKTVTDEVVLITSINYHLKRGVALVKYEQYLKKLLNSTIVETSLTETEEQEVLITYSWDSEEHQQKVLSLTEYLRKAGFHANIDVKLAQEESAIDFIKMMHSSLLLYKKVIIVLSKLYKEKAEKFIRGVGVEYLLILKDIDRNPRKYILVTFEGIRDDIIPYGLVNREIVDLSNKLGFDKLVRKLMDMPEYEFSKVSMSKPILTTKSIASFDQSSVVGLEQTDTLLARGSIGQKFQQILNKTKEIVNERRSHILANNLPVEFETTAKIALHLIPASSIEFNSDYDFSRIESDIRLVREINGKSTTPRYDFFGWMSSSKAPGPEKNNYVRVFRNGIIEAVNGELFYPYQNELRLPAAGSINYEALIVEAIEGYIVFYKKLNVELPIYLFISYLGVKGYYIASERLTNSGLKDKLPVSEIYKDGIMITSFNQDIPASIKNVFDTVWNGCGYERSINYDQNGKWKPLLRNS